MVIAALQQMPNTSLSLVLLIKLGIPVMWGKDHPNNMSEEEELGIVFQEMKREKGRYVK